MDSTRILALSEIESHLLVQSTKCPVCRHAYTNEAPPLALICSHSICRPCMEAQPDGSAHFCPICRSALGYVGNDEFPVCKALLDISKIVNHCLVRDGQATPTPFRRGSALTISSRGSSTSSARSEYSTMRLLVDSTRDKLENMLFNGRESIRDLADAEGWSEERYSAAQRAFGSIVNAQIAACDTFIKEDQFTAALAESKFALERQLVQTNPDLNRNAKRSKSIRVLKRLFGADKT